MWVNLLALHPPIPPLETTTACRWLNTTITTDKSIRWKEVRLTCDSARPYISVSWSCSIKWSALWGEGVLLLIPPLVTTSQVMIITSFWGLSMATYSWRCPGLGLFAPRCKTHYGSGILKLLPRQEMTINSQWFALRKIKQLKRAIYTLESRMHSFVISILNQKGF